MFSFFLDHVRATIRIFCLSSISLMPLTSVHIVDLSLLSTMLILLSCEGNIFTVGLFLIVLLLTSMSLFLLSCYCC